MTDTDPFAYAKEHIRTNGGIRQSSAPARTEPTMLPVGPGVMPRWTDPVYWRLIRLLAKFGKPGVEHADQRT